MVCVLPLHVLMYVFIEYIVTSLQLYELAETRTCISGDFDAKEQYSGLELGAPRNLDVKLKNTKSTSAF